MKNRTLLALLAVVLVVSLVAFGACAKEEEAPPVEEEAPPVEEEAPPVEEEAPPVEEAWEWPEKLYVVSTGTASVGYGLGVAWTTPLAKDTGMKIRLVTSETAAQRHKWIASGEFLCTGIDLPTADWIEATGESGRPYASREGGSYQARIMYPIAKTYSGFAVRGDSGIKTPRDIKPGVRVVCSPTLQLGPTLEGLLAWAGLTEEDVIKVPVGSFAGYTRAIIEGRADVTAGLPSSPAWYEAEAAPHGLSWIDMNPEEDPEGAAIWAKWQPWLPLGIMTQGVESAIGKWGMLCVGPYATSAQSDPELVYHVVKWLDENHDKYKDAHPFCAAMTIDNLMELSEKFCIPLHEGTVKYLEELGLWDEAHEVRRQYNIDLVTQWVEAYQTAIEMADEQSIEVDPANDEWINLWTDFSKDLPKFKMFTSLEGGEMEY